MEGKTPIVWMPPLPEETEPPCVCRSIPAGMRLVGFCKDCKWWDRVKCPIVISTEEGDDEHITRPDFGCVRWEAKVKKAAEEAGLELPEG